MSSVKSEPNNTTTTNNNPWLDACNDDEYSRAAFSLDHYSNHTKNHNHSTATTTTGSTSMTPSSRFRNNFNNNKNNKTKRCITTTNPEYDINNNNNNNMNNTNNESIELLVSNEIRSWNEMEEQIQQQSRIHFCRTVLCRYKPYQIIFMKWFIRFFTFCDFIFTIFLIIYLTKLEWNKKTYKNNNSSSNNKNHRVASHHVLLIVIGMTCLWFVRTITAMYSLHTRSCRRCGLYITSNLISCITIGTYILLTIVYTVVALDWTNLPNHYVATYLKNHAIALCIPPYVLHHWILPYITSPLKYIHYIWFCTTFLSILELMRWQFISSYRIFLLQCDEQQQLTSANNTASIDFNNIESAWENLQEPLISGEDKYGIPAWVEQRNPALLVTTQDDVLLSEREQPLQTYQDEDNSRLNMTTTTTTNNNNNNRQRCDTYKSSNTTSFWKFWMKQRSTATNGNNHPRDNNQDNDDDGDNNSVNFASVQEEWAIFSEEDPFWWSRDESEQQQQQQSQRMRQHKRQLDSEWASSTK